MTVSHSHIINDLSELSGSKVTLRPVTEDMAEDMFEATSESQTELNPFMPWENQVVQDAKDFIERSARSREQGEELQLAIFERETDEFVGMIGLFQLDPFTPKGTIGYWIRTSKAGSGFATDAVSTLLAFCQQRLDLARVDACVASGNPASQRVLEKCGFRREGLKERAELCHGQWHDVVMYGIVFPYDQKQKDSHSPQ
ncbi:MAG TPA: GNAT family protein [bacterium]|nr:GNAT family protein [bacterium]